MLVIVKNGKAALHQKNGSRVRSIGVSGAVSAALSGDESFVAVCYSSGKVIVYKAATDSYFHAFAMKDAIGVSFSGNDVVITHSTGKSELYKANGSRIRSL